MVYREWVIITDRKRLADFFVVGKIWIQNCFKKWNIDTKILPKYNKNENKLYLKEDVEKMHQ